MTFCDNTGLFPHFILMGQLEVRFSCLLCSYTFPLNCEACVIHNRTSLFTNLLPSVDFQHRLFHRYPRSRLAPGNPRFSFIFLKSALGNRHFPRFAIHPRSSDIYPRLLLSLIAAYPRRSIAFILDRPSFSSMITIHHRSSKAFSLKSSKAFSREKSSI